MNIIRKPLHYREFEKEFRKKYLEIYNKDLEEYITSNKKKPSWFKKLQLQYVANKKTLKAIDLPSKKPLNKII